MADAGDIGTSGASLHWVCKHCECCCRWGSTRCWSCGARKSKPAADRRAQYRRAHGKAIKDLLASFEAVATHRGGRLNRLSTALRAALAGNGGVPVSDGKGGNGDIGNAPGDGGMGVAAHTVPPSSPSVPNCSPNAAAFCESGKGGKGDIDHTPGDGGMGVAARAKAKEAGTHARAGKGIGGDTVGVNPAGMVGHGDSDNTPGEGGMDGTALEARSQSRSTPDALPREPLEFPLGDNMDLAAIRVKVQRLSDEIAGALVSLEELVLVPTAVVEDAGVQTVLVLDADHGGNGTREGVSMAVNDVVTARECATVAPFAEFGSGTSYESAASGEALTRVGELASDMAVVYEQVGQILDMFPLELVGSVDYSFLLKGMQLRLRSFHADLRLQLAHRQVPVPPHLCLYSPPHLFEALRL